MQQHLKLSTIDYQKTIINYLIIIILGAIILFILAKMNLWKVIAPSDKVFVGLVFVILFSTFGTRYKKDEKKRRK